MAPVDVAGEAAKAAPGIVGALVALRWMPGTPLQRLSSFVGGSAASYYGTDHMAHALELAPGFTGFLLGLFGMAVASKVFEAIDGLRIGRRVEKLLDRWGL